jgi:hypothetical protein
VSRPIHEVKPLQARLVRSWETRLEVRVLSVLYCTSMAEWMQRLVGPMDKVSASEAGDSGFESRAGLISITLVV